MSKTAKTTLYLKVQMCNGGTTEQVATRALVELKKANITHNSANKLITVENLERLCCAMLRDINNSKKGWWATFKVQKDEKTDVVKFVQKIATVVKK